MLGHSLPQKKLVYRIVIIIVTRKFVYNVNFINVENIKIFSLSNTILLFDIYIHFTEYLFIFKGGLSDKGVYLVETSLKKGI